MAYAAESAAEDVRELLDVLNRDVGLLRPAAEGVVMAVEEDPAVAVRLRPDEVERVCGHERDLMGRHAEALRHQRIGGWIRLVRPRLCDGDDRFELGDEVGPNCREHV